MVLSKDKTERYSVDWQTQDEVNAAIKALDEQRKKELEKNPDANKDHEKDNDESMYKMHIYSQSMHNYHH
jgi:hypothetical protein